MHKELIIKILNTFENDSGLAETEYNKIYLYKDGPNQTRQTTLGRGFVESGSLWTVFKYYKNNEGKHADKLLSYINQKGKETLPKNREFLALIIEACKEQGMKDAQDQVFDDLYWDKGLKYFNENGFVEQLSLAVIQDSILHSGGMLKFLVNSFTEKKPINGGNEKVWIKSYLEVRKNWLENKSKLLSNTTYRCIFFLDQIDKDNWDLSKFPIFPNGTKISSVN